MRAARFGARLRGGDDRTRDAQEIDDLVAGDGAGRQVVGEAGQVGEGLARELQTFGIAHDAAVGRHHPLERAAHRLRLRRSCLREHDRIGIGRPGRAQLEDAGHRAGRVGRRLAVHDRLDHAAPEDQPVEE